LNPDTFKLEPGLCIPVDNPQGDVRQLEISIDLEAATWKEQALFAYGEKLTGLSDMQMGRQSDRPNAPRTATQTVKLLEEGNVRISLDTKVLAEDMGAVLAHFWALEYEYSPAETFFRVTEDDADGAFEVNNGGSILTEEDRDGRFDFRLKFANSLWSKEARKEQALARYQLDLQNPLVMQNPQALWEATRGAHDALGDPTFEALVPKPPMPDAPVDPKTEWVNLMHGEDVHVNPMDNDVLHMTRHMQDLKRSESDSKHSDPEATQKLILHYHEHIVQLQQKKIQQAVIEQAVQAAQQLAQGGGGGGKPLQFPQGLFGNMPSQPPGNPQAQGPFLYGAPAVSHEQ
jgi:hypothetical protein